MSWNKAEWEYMEAFRQDVKEEFSGLRKTLYGEEGNSGIVADVNGLKAGAKRRRVITYSVVVPLTIALVGGMATIVAALM